MNIDKTYSTLKQYGFTEYEAKIYVALLQSNPLNGNEIAIKSGVPSPKVYENLNRMCEKEVVFPVLDGNYSTKKLYSPLPYKELLRKIELDFQNDTAFMESQFKVISNQMKPDWSELYHLDGYVSSIDSLRNMIQSTEQTIYLSCWNSELELLWDDLLEAFKKGVRVISILFDVTDKKIPWLHFTHHQGEFSDRRHTGELSCVLDEKSVFILHSAEGNAHAIISSHTALTRTTLNYIRHDIYINQVVNHFHDELAAKYGENFGGLLDIF
ncbi:helix-turn-helix domain-containing protein [Lederbergia citrisecunda]|uniref:TrmB family transcriptional regulator n=1 Tax=Lederbergia citrisecunda TaxID=2833583 RepID=UPI003D2A799C